MRRPSLFAGALGVAIAATVLPLWSAHYLPLVDLPQHLHLINVLGHLGDPRTLYPELFKPRGEITPYEGYYYAVWALARIFPLFTANAIYLSLCAILTPLSVLALLSALGGNRWLALLACPLFYGDNFYWGFINYCASLPLLLFALALFIRVLEAPPDRRFAREIELGLLLLAVQLTHVQSFVYAGVALPLLLLATPTDKARRIRAVLAAVPAAALFAIWSLGRLGDKPDVAPGQPWKAWGPLLSRENLSFNPVGANLSRLPELLANGLRDQADRPVVWLLAAVALLALVLSAISRPERVGALPLHARLRGPMLAAIALAMFLFMPFDVRGYMYYVNFRFAEMFALLAICALPMPGGGGFRAAVAAPALAIAVWYGATLTSHFHLFEREASGFDEVASAVSPEPRIMALIFDTSSAVMSHPVYLHFASYAAMAQGGVTSFSFASTAHSPLAYQGGPPPAPPSEWHPEQFRFAAYGEWYDFYLERGSVPARYVFQGGLDAVALVAHAGPWTLFRRAR